jgi:hypothetical protein
MAKYVLKYNELADMEQSLMSSEFERLESWLHETGIDEDFDRDEHIYVDAETGDRWMFLPELNSKQLFALELIVSSSEVVKDDRPLRRGPAVRETIDEEESN